MNSSIDVVVFLNGASETSIPLEIVSKIESESIRIQVCSLFEPDENTFGLDVRSLDADSQVDLGAYRRLYSILKEMDPDVFHVNPNATGSVARVVAKMAGVPHIVTTEHNLHTEFGHFMNLINGGTNWLNDAVICNSKTTSNSFSRWEDLLLMLGRTQREIIYNGVDIDRIKNPAGERDPPSLRDKFTFGTAGRLVDQKNLEAIIESVAKLDNSVDIHIAIVGKGPKKEDLENFAKKLGVKNKLEFLGYLPERTDVYTFFDEIDVFLFPSHYEGFGVAVVEAMATGTPVIVNDIPVLREVVGDVGVFVDATDYDELAAAMEKLYVNDEKRRRLGGEAKNRVEKEFTLEKTVEKYTSVYQRLVWGSG